MNREGARFNIRHSLSPPVSVAHPFEHGPALDNGMFMVALAYHAHRQFPDEAFLRSILPALRRGLEFVPRNRGLVFNDPQQPSSTYGFSGYRREGRS